MPHDRSSGTRSGLLPLLTTVVLLAPALSFAADEPPTVASADENLPES